MISGSKCFCGWSSVPPRDFCIKCRRKMESADFAELGEVLSYTVENVVPEGFKPPLYLAMVRLKGNPKILCAVENGWWLEMEKEVSVEKRNELYYAKPLTMLSKISGFLKRSVEILKKGSGK
ncbi:MAG: hypothetical protein AB1633_07175 [Elusimicrobiota bacterium]